MRGFWSAVEQIEVGNHAFCEERPAPGSTSTTATLYTTSPGSLYEGSQRTLTLATLPGKPELAAAMLPPGKPPPSAPPSPPQSSDEWSEEEQVEEEVEMAVEVEGR